MSGLVALMQSPGKPARITIDGKEVAGIVTRVDHSFDGGYGGDITVTIMPQREDRFERRPIEVRGMADFEREFGPQRCRGTLVALYPDTDRPADEDAPTWCPDCASRLERDAARQAYVCPDAKCGHMVTDERIRRRARP